MIYILVLTQLFRQVALSLFLIRLELLKLSRMPAPQLCSRWHWLTAAKNWCGLFIIMSCMKYPKRIWTKHFRLSWTYCIDFMPSRRVYFSPFNLCSGCTSFEFFIFCYNWPYILIRLFVKTLFLNYFHTCLWYIPISYQVKFIAETVTNSALLLDPKVVDTVFNGLQLVSPMGKTICDSCIMFRMGFACIWVEIIMG